MELDTPVTNEPVATEDAAVPVTATATATTTITNTDAPVTATAAAATSSNAPETEEESPVLVEGMAREYKLPYDIRVLDSVYGPGQRGLVASVQISAGTLIHQEDAAVYLVSPSQQDSGSFFAAESFARVPEELQKMPDGDKLELTCILIETNPRIARLLSHPIMGLHGRISFNGRDKKAVLDELHAYFVKRCPDCVFPEPIPVELAAADETDKWTRDQFLRLFAIVCLNAVRPVAPMSAASYGTALFRATSLVNHSCTPNAVIMYQPGKANLIALSDIAPGEEITVSYVECPRDLLSENLITLLHYDAGVVSVESGSCRCAMCTCRRFPAAPASR